MPIYEYECPHCGKFETTQGMREAVLAACPKCGEPVRRLISGGVGLIFKGSGFYTTDYRKPDYQKRQKEESAKAEAPSSPGAGDAGTGSGAPAEKGSGGGKDSTATGGADSAAKPPDPK